MFTPTLVNNVRTWHAIVPDGEVVIYEPFATWSLWSVYGPKGTGHYSNAHSEDEAMTEGAEAVAYYSGTAPNMMGRWYTSDEVSPPADADARTTAIVDALLGAARDGGK